MKLEPAAVKWFATITIWVVGIMGIFPKATVALGLAGFIETFNLGISKHLVTFLALGIPTYKYGRCNICCYCSKVNYFISYSIIFDYYW